MCKLAVNAERMQSFASDSRVTPVAGRHVYGGPMFRAMQSSAPPITFLHSRAEIPNEAHATDVDDDDKNELLFSDGRSNVHASRVRVPFEAGVADAGTCSSTGM